MGQAPSTPRPDATLKVIGAEMSRTGTASFTQALTILLQGPVYHGGTQLTLGPDVIAKTWIYIISHRPVRDSTDREVVFKGLRNIYDGYLGCTDAPGHAYVEELLELYPDAIVICTVRDKEAWIKSMGFVANAVHMNFLSWILWPLPTIHYLVPYCNRLEWGRWTELYYQHGVIPGDWSGQWDNHISYLKRVVPEHKLFFYDVSQGWGPLCEILGCELPPPGTQSPRINDGKAIEDMAKVQIRRGLMAWTGILGGVAAVTNLSWQYWSRGS